MLFMDTFTVFDAFLPHFPLDLTMSTFFTQFYARHGKTFLQHFSRDYVQRFAPFPRFQEYLKWCWREKQGKIAPTCFRWGKELELLAKCIPLRLLPRLSVPTKNLCNRLIFGLSLFITHGLSSNQGTVSNIRKISD